MQVVCNAEFAGLLDCILELSSGNGKTQQLTVTAVALQPAIALSATQVSIGDCYVGVPIWREMVMSNLTMLPTAFAWEGYGAGRGGQTKGQMSVTIDREQGLLPPGNADNIVTNCETNPAFMSSCRCKMELVSVKIAAHLLLCSNAVHWVDCAQLGLYFWTPVLDVAFFSVHSSSRIHVRASPNRFSITAASWCFSG